MLSDQLVHVRQRIAQACQRSHRDPRSVRLVGVTKGVSVYVIRQAAGLGVADIGENRVQEARSKYRQLHSDHPEVRWHLIGHLQRNKAKHAMELFDVIHSVDSMELAEELERQAAKRPHGRGLPEVFVQVNVSGEATKFGCTPEKMPDLARAVLQLPHLSLRGLMTIAPFRDDPEEARPHFRRLRRLRDELHQQLVNASLFTHHSSLLLSMGMSQDFEVAIEEGADVVRIGTAIFGNKQLSD